MAEPTQQRRGRQQRPRYTVHFLNPVRQQGYYDCAVEIYDNHRACLAEGRIVVFRAGGQPEVRVSTDQFGTARTRMTFQASTTITVLAEGQIKTFPDLPGFAHARTNVPKPTDEDIKGWVWTAARRVINKAREQWRRDRGRG